MRFGVAAMYLNNACARHGEHTGLPHNRGLGYDGRGIEDEGYLVED